MLSKAIQQINHNIMFVVILSIVSFTHLFILTYSVKTKQEPIVSHKTISVKIIKEQHKIEKIHKKPIKKEVFKKNKIKKTLRKTLSKKKSIQQKRPKKQIKKEQTKPKEQTKKEQTPIKSSTAQPKNNAIKNEYLANLRDAIDANKRYPKVSKRLQEKGNVLVSFRIFKNGTINNITLVTSSGKKRLDRAAIKAVAKIKKYKKFPKELQKDFIDLTLPIKFEL